MKSTRWARGFLGFAVFVAAASAQQPAKKPPAEAITGTISSSQSIIEAVLGQSNRPARWQGITFLLKEQPQRQFVFNSPSFEHNGRSLVDNLKGTQVQVTCKMPAQKTCRVATLNWLSPPAPPPPKKKQ